MKNIKYSKHMLLAVIAITIFASCEKSIEPDTINDDAPLTVKKITPTDKATGVDPTTDIVVEFNKPIDLGSVNNSTFWISNMSETNNEFGSITQQGSTAILKLENTLDEGATYEFGLTTGITTSSGESLDKDYLITFTTKEPDDNIAPTITSFSIEEGNQSVSADSEVKITFSEPVTQSSISGISLKDTDSGATVDVDISISGSVVTVSPKESLFGNHWHKLKVPASIQDAAGNVLGSDSELTFETKNSEFTASSFYPADGATNVEIDETIKITFQRDIDPASVSEETVELWQVDPDGSGYVVVAGNYDVKGNVVEFIPNEPLREFLNEYYIIVSQVRDSKNNYSDFPSAIFNTTKVSSNYYYFIRARFNENSYLTYDPHQTNLFMSNAFINHTEKKWKILKNGNDSYGIVSNNLGDNYGLNGTAPDDGYEVYMGIRPNTNSWHSNQSWQIELSNSEANVTIVHNGYRLNGSIMDLTYDHRNDAESYFKLIRADMIY